MVVIGLGRQGKALARFLAERGSRVVVSDVKPAEALTGQREELADVPVEFVLGSHPPELIEGADLVCLSGGVPADLPLAQQARERGIPLSNDSQLFLESCPAPTIGVTGSAGKTTTITLVGRMAAAELASSGRRAWVGGNIGRPLLADLPEVRPEDWVVMELSSFQLELMTTSTRVAAVLNLTPNHLDRHHTLEAYAAAKARILTGQTPEGIAVLGRDDPGAWGFRSLVRGRLLSFGWEPAKAGEGAYVGRDGIRVRIDGRDELACPRQAIALRGEHNVLNVAAACAISAAAGFSTRSMEAGVRGFAGVSHRLEFVRRVNRVDWYNDSIATAPERAMAAIRSFDEPLVLLAGGRDKDLPWEGFAQLVCERVDHLVLFGEAAAKILLAVQAARKHGRPYTWEVCPGLETAVQAAARVAKPGDVVLLAPGGTSFDEFADFVERGERFRMWVEAL